MAILASLKTVIGFSALAPVMARRVVAASGWPLGRRRPSKGLDDAVSNDPDRHKAVDQEDSRAPPLIRFIRQDGLA